MLEAANISRVPQVTLPPYILLLSAGYVYLSITKIFVMMLTMLTARHL